MLSVNLSVCFRDNLSVFLENIGNCSSCLIEEATDSTFISYSLSWKLWIYYGFWLCRNSSLEIRISNDFRLINDCRLRCLRKFRIRLRVVWLILSKHV